MTVYEERDYEFYMEKGNNFLDTAEKFYEEKNLSNAIKSFYYASMNFEMAKGIAEKVLDIGLQLNAKDKEFYCLEKIDELQQFKNTNLDEYVR